MVLEPALIVRNPLFRRVRRPELEYAPIRTLHDKATASDQHLADVTCFQVGATLPEEVPAIRLFDRCLLHQPAVRADLGKGDPFGFLERDHSALPVGELMIWL